MRLLFEIASLALIVGPVHGSIGPSSNIFIKNKFIQPDGFNRSGVLAGATENSVSFPGPLIAGNRGDTFALNVVDQLTNTSMDTSTSIHWHGIFQKGTNWADGPAGVTQCPIAPGHSFLYQFRVPDQAGTFWYHSHYSNQYCDGLRGPLVVYDPNDPFRSQYDFDDESTVITLADWYHFPSPVIAAILAPAQPNATLINGKGRYPGGPNTSLAVISVMPTKRYRFRLVSISCDPSFTFSIDGHNLTIIEVDANNVQPLTVDSINIFAGQRYSFILHANNHISNYWIRSLPSSTPTGFDNGVNSAILRYVGAPNKDPNTNQSTTNPLQETNLHPLVYPAAPGIPKVGAADVNINLDITFNGTEWAVNNASFVPPPIPVLLQILSGARTPQDLLPPGDVYLLPPNKVIELAIPGGSIGSPHPMHLHGHAFSVVRSAGSSVYNYHNPVRRDVVSAGVSTNDNVTIRFVTDNAGPWILHCHIDWHLSRGLAVVMAENIPAIAHERPPAAWDQLCPIFDMQTHP